MSKAAGSHKNNLPPQQAASGPTTPVYLDPKAPAESAPPPHPKTVPSATGGIQPPNPTASFPFPLGKLIAKSASHKHNPEGASRG